MNATDERERVGQALKKAFPLCPMSGDPGALTHEECMGLRSRLISLTLEDFFEVLPRLLEDLLDTHTDRPGDPEDADHVIDILDVPTVGADGRFARERWGRDTFLKIRDDEEDLRSTKYSMFETVTHLQASAISMWLVLARSWKDLEWNIDEVNSALVYWNSRLKTRR
jgi:hypothetical protein